MSEFRNQIVLDFAKWTALSGLRSGAPIKSRAHVYPLLDAVTFGDVLGPGPPITGPEFDAWHEAQTLALCARDLRVQVGWGAKLVNVYLNYVGDLGGRASARLSIRPSTRGSGTAWPCGSGGSQRSWARCAACVR